MSLKEFLLYADAFRRKRDNDYKTHRINAYEQSVLTATFVGAMLSGHQIPSIEEIYPEIIPEEQKKEDEAKQMAFLRDQFIDYAERHNQQRRQESLKDGNN